MTERRISKEEFFANGGYKSRSQWSSGPIGQEKYWTNRKAS